MIVLRIPKGFLGTFLGAGIPKGLLGHRLTGVPAAASAQEVYDVVSATNSSKTWTHTWQRRETQSSPITETTPSSCFRAVRNWRMINSSERASYVGRLVVSVGRRVALIEKCNPANQCCCEYRFRQDNKSSSEPISRHGRRI